MRVRYGAVVRAPIEELWESKDSQNRIGETYIYGVITNEDDYNKNSILSTWCVNWTIEHLSVPENDVPYNLCCGIDETKLELMMNKDDPVNPTIKYPLEEYFEKDYKGGAGERLEKGWRRA